MYSDQLRYLIETSKQPSLSAAAQKLHMTPQALSMSIKTLEDELELTLLNRTYKGVSLTEDGQEVVKLAKQFFRGMDKLQQRKMTESPWAELSGEMTLPAAFGDTNYYLPKVIADLYREAPHLHLNVMPCDPNSLVQQVIDGQLEFALLYRCWIDQEKSFVRYVPEVEFTSLFTHRLVCLAHTKFPISKYKTTTIKNLLQYPLVFMHHPDEVQPLYQKIICKFGVPRKIILQKREALYQEMLASGQAMTLSIAPRVQREAMVISGDLCQISIKDNIRVEIGYITKKDMPLSHHAQLLLNYLTEYAQSHCL